MAVLAAVPSIVLAAAHPALAAQVIGGVGAGTGWEYASDITSDCALPPLTGNVSTDHFVITDTGTYTGTNPSGTGIAQYTGSTTVVLDVAAHVISPAGVGPSCSLPVGPVTITGATVDGTDSFMGVAGSVHCTIVAGSPASVYTRVNNVVAFSFVSDCTIKGNTGLLTATVHANPTVHSITGTMNPCDLPFPPFLHNPECDVNNPGDGPSSHLVVAYTASGATAP